MPSKHPGIVYLLHFSAPVHPFRPARHYIGWTSEEKGAEGRLQDHQTGQGARITAAASGRGISFIIARTWKGSRRFERRLKCRKNAPRLCPLCSPR